MKFGLFYNPQVPKPLDQDDWEPEQERERFHAVLDQIELADKVGFDYVVLGEHHFTAEYAHNSSPEVLLGAISQRTKRIRLVTGIMHMSHNDPIRTAERIATLDLVSDGRIEFGAGTGTGSEIVPFVGGDPEVQRGRAASATQIAVDILGERGIYPGHHDEYFDIPPINVIPKSYQRPHPPLWMSTTNAEGTKRAAREGVGILQLTAAGPEELAQRVEEYWATLKAEAKPIGKAANPSFFAFASALMAPTREEAIARGRESIEFFAYGLMGGQQLTQSDPKAHLRRAFVDWKEGRGDARERLGVPPQALEMSARFADLPSNLLGTPDDARVLLEAFERTNVDAILFREFEGWMRHEHVMESIELLGTQVLPEFRARHAAHEAWRAEQLKDFPYPTNSSV